MTPDDVVRLLALAWPLEPVTADNAVITEREVEHLLELAVSMQPQLAALAAAAAAAAAERSKRARKRPRTEPAPLQTRQKPRAPLLALPMAASHSSTTQKPRKALAALPMAASHSSTTQKPRKALAALPMATSHTYWDKPITLTARPTHS